MVHNAEYYFGAAREMDRQGEREEAIATLTKAIELDPQHFGAIMQRGHQYAKKDDLDRALADYTLAAQLEPNNPIAYDYQGQTLEKMGDIKGACNAYQLALQHSPSPINSKRMRDYISEYGGK